MQNFAGLSVTQKMICAESLLKKRHNLTAEQKRNELIKILFPEQRKFVLDESDSKAAICSRQAGKTFCCAVYLYYVALVQEGNQCLYIALTQKSAKKILWRDLQHINNIVRIGAKFNNVELLVTLPNNSQIYIEGADKEVDSEKFRGPRLALVVLDESASFRPHIKYLVKEVLTPTLIKNEGTIALIGTPHPSCAGFFYDVTAKTKKKNGDLVEPGWAIHHWTIHNNIYIAHAEKWLAKKRKQMGWDEHDPSYQRDWLGKWVRSTETVIYKFKHVRDNAVALPLPRDKWEYILGVDLGFRDAAAFVVIAYSPVYQTAYIVRAEKYIGMLPDDIAEFIKDLEEEYRVTDRPYTFQHIIADAGALGLMIVEEINQRHGLGITPAEKTGKNAFIEIVNTNFKQERLKVISQDCEPLITEMQILSWDEAKKLKGVHKEDDRYDNHCCDAMAYAFRFALHYRSEPEEQVPRTRETYAKTEEKRLMLIAQKQALREQQMTNNFGDNWYDTDTSKSNWN